MMCTSGKKTYMTRGVAKSASRTIKSWGKGRMRVYQCHLCGFWHLTSNLVRLSRKVG